MNLFVLSSRPFFVRLSFVIAAAISLQSKSVFAHPGHDHHAPQYGIMHWLLAPTHAIPILACLGIIVGLAIWKLRSSNRLSATVDMDSSES
jgi:hydrogenase/urease accessory protein HupE